MAERLNMADITPTEAARAQMLDQAVAQATRRELPKLGPEIPILRPPTPEPTEQPRRQPSVFENVLNRIRALQRQPPSADRDTALQAAVQERDRLREAANELVLLQDVKADLFEIYYGARVGITKTQKLYGESGMPPKLQELRDRQARAETTSWEDTWENWEEGLRGFWSDPGRQAQVATYGGIADDFYRQSLSLIRGVVQNRHRYERGYPENIEVFNKIWNYNWESEHERTYELTTFDDVRELVERERKKRYWVPNRGDYDSWIQLVADDLHEVEESIPFILDYIRTKFEPDDPNKVFETLEQEKGKIIKAIEKYGFERGYEVRKPEFRMLRRLKSRLGTEINLLGAEFFAKLVHEDWGPYLKYMGTIARSFHDTETQDHFVDAMYLDNEGMMGLALHKFEENDGEYWRYGKNTAATPTHFQIKEGQRWQERKREEILNFLVNRELRPMEELLRDHPAFQKLKAQMDDLDSNDPDYWNNPAFKTRWQEYVEKVLDWERSGKQGDPRETQRVLFQHPLARAFLNDEEFEQMFRDIQRRNNETNDQFERRLRAKKERVQTVIETALRMATAFQQDVSAGGPRHILTADQKQALGLPVDDEAIPHDRLIRVMSERAVREDAAKPWKLRKFKITHVLKDILHIHRNLPLFSNWYLGAHDTIRPGLIANGISKVSELMEWLREKRQVRALDPDDYLGGDEKTSITREIESGDREFTEMLEVYAREVFGNYFNFPGHDTEGGGNKEARNLNKFPYGQSWGTIELSSLIKHMWLGEQDFLHAFGCSSWKQFVGLAKGGNEIVFNNMGGLFESPRDAEYWVRRIGAIVEQSKLLTSGGEKGGHGVFNDGWGSGFFLWRALNRAASFLNVDQVNKAFQGTKTPIDQFTTIRDSDMAYHNLDQKTYEAYVKLAFQFVAPLVSIFETRLKIENVYSRNPGTAMFLNTFTWYSVSQWMDRNWEEYRGKFGNALDVDLHMARMFIRTALYESRFIYYDDQWDQRMLGYTIPKAEWEYIQNTNWDSMTEDERKKYRPITKIISYETDSQGRTIAQEDIKDRDDNVIVKKGNSVEGERISGILDAFPKEWRDEIIARHNQKEEPWIIPMGLNTEYPETLGVIKQLKKFGEHSGMRSIYEKLFDPNEILKQIRQRKTVNRAA